MDGRVSLGLALVALVALGAPMPPPHADAQKKAAVATRPRLGARKQAAVNERKSTPTKRKRRRRSGPGRVLRLQGDVIKGRVQKPEAFYVLERTGVTFDGLKLNTKLVPKILRALAKPPF